jgi:hypothetical protein
MRQRGSQYKPEQRADDAQQAEAEGAGKIGLEHDRRRHWNPVTVRHVRQPRACHSNGEAHGTAQCMPAGDRRQAHVCAQYRERIAWTQRARKARFLCVEAQLAAATGEFRVARQRAQLSGERMCVGEGDGQHATRVRIGATVFGAVDPRHRGFVAFERRRGCQRTDTRVERTGDRIERARGIFAQACEGRLERRIVDAFGEAAEREKFEPDALDDFRQHAERLHRGTAGAEGAVQQVFDVGQGLRHRRRLGRIVAPPSAGRELPA